MARTLRGENRVYVHDDAGEVHFYDPGDDVPTWAAKKITNPDAWATVDEAEPVDPENPDGDPGRDTEKPYSDWKNEALQAEIDRRNEGRADDDLIVVEGKGNKPDLVAALEGDDAAQAE